MIDRFRNSVSKSFIIFIFNFFNLFKNSYLIRNDKWKNIYIYILYFPLPNKLTSSNARGYPCFQIYYTFRIAEIHAKFTKICEKNRREWYLERSFARERYRDPYRGPGFTHPRTWREMQKRFVPDRLWSRKITFGSLGRASSARVKVSRRMKGRIFTWRDQRLCDDGDGEARRLRASPFQRLAELFIDALKGQTTKARIVAHLALNATAREILVSYPNDSL